MFKVSLQNVSRKPFSRMFRLGAKRHAGHNFQQLSGADKKNSANSFQEAVSKYVQAQNKKLLRKAIKRPLWMCFNFRPRSRSKKLPEGWFQQCSRSYQINRSKMLSAGRFQTLSGSDQKNAPEGCQQAELQHFHSQIK